MLYQVIIEPNAKDDLYNIFSYIKTYGSIQSAKNFLEELRKQIKSLDYMPNRCRDSLYFKDGKTKDLIYKGYTISYHIKANSVHIVAVFRQRNY